MGLLKRLFAGLLAIALLGPVALARPSIALALTSTAPGGLTAAGNPDDPGSGGHDDRTLGSDDTESGITARAAGVVSGQIAAVDYQRGVLSVLTQQHGRIDVRVLPSTNIHGRNDAFLTIGDLNRGSRVEIFLSTVGGHYVAQIIRLH